MVVSGAVGLPPAENLTRDGLKVLLLKAGDDQGQQVQFQSAGTSLQIYIRSINVSTSSKHEKRLLKPHD